MDPYWFEPEALTALIGMLMNNPPPLVQRPNPMLHLLEDELKIDPILISFVFFLSVQNMHYIRKTAMFVIMNNKVAGVSKKKLKTDPTLIYFIFSLSLSLENIHRLSKQPC